MKEALVEALQEKKGVFHDMDDNDKNVIMPLIDAYIKNSKSKAFLSNKKKADYANTFNTIQ